MKIYDDISLSNFEFWSGAKDRAANLTIDDFDEIERQLEYMYPDGMSATELNDTFWFEFDTIAQMLGYENEEDMDLKRDPNYVDDDDLETYANKWTLKFIEEHKNYPHVLLDIADLLDLFDDYLEEYPNDECGVNGDQIAEYLINRLPDRDVMSCMFDEDSAGHAFCPDVPETNELRKMAMKEKELSNKN